MVITRLQGLEKVARLKSKIQELTGDIKANTLDAKAWSQGSRKNKGIEVVLKVADNLFKLPILKGTKDETAIDVSALRHKDRDNVITFDPGFKSTGSCASAITFIDGDKGELKYRGYPIEEVVDKLSFLETAELLFNGKLPDEQALSTTRDGIVNAMCKSALRTSIEELIQEHSNSTHPMNIMSAVVALMRDADLPAEEGEPELPLKNKLDEQDFRRIMALTSFAVAKLFKEKTNTVSVDEVSLNIDEDRNPVIDSSKGYIQNLVNMFYGDKRPGNLSEEALVEIFNKLLILHADHEQNCSTSTVRMVASSKADPYSAIAAGINALSGSAHGGANQDVINNLEKIYQEADERASELPGTQFDFEERFNNAVEKILDEQIRIAALGKDNPQQKNIPGIGHRVYKNNDPRAGALKKLCDKYLDGLATSSAGTGHLSALLKIAKRLEEKIKNGTADDPGYFTKRGLYPNVDFYSGILYKALGVPEDMFTVMFALGRLPGWLAHIKEQEDIAGGRDNLTIYRPRQIYVGDKSKKLDSNKTPSIGLAA